MKEMAENDDFKKLLSDALRVRAEWLEKSELPKLKDELRSYHTGFASLYNIYLKKGLINEDPYKQEAKIGELEVPPSTAFPEAERLDQLTRRLANYDNQLDFLVNFYQFSPEFLSLDRIKRIVGLIKYIDWVRLSPDSQSPMTKAAAIMTNQVKTGSDPLTMSLITESLANLNRTYNPIMGYLKNLTDYQKEAYKLEIRDVTEGMPQADALNIQNVKRKFASMKSGIPFYLELVEEVIKEDYSSEGPSLREEILKKLKVAEEKPKTPKTQISFRNVLIDGIQILGGTAQTFSTILTKLDENQAILENEKNGFMQKLKKLMQQMFKREPEPIIYDVEYMDPLKGVLIHEKVNFPSFRSDLERKTRTLTPMAVRSGGSGKLDSLQEEQLVGFLERNIKELQSLHKTLSALDELYKADVSKENRERIKGIKPELATIKNALVRANAKRHEYGSQKEEEEQLKRLGAKSEF